MSQELHAKTNEENHDEEPGHVHGPNCSHHHHHHVETVVRDAPKVGRNDPCPCGSQQKYKKCHGK